MFSFEKKYWGCIFRLPILVDVAIRKKQFIFSYIGLIVLGLII